MYNDNHWASTPLNMRQSSASVRLLSTDPTGGGSTTTYHMRGWDDGGARWVTWTSTDTPDTSPASGDTTPNWSGSLSAPHVSYTVVA